MQPTGQAGPSEIEEGVGKSNQNYRGGERASALFHWAARAPSGPLRPDLKQRGAEIAPIAQIASRRRSRLARPDRGGDRVSRTQIAVEIAFRSTAQIPADLGAFGSFSATCSSGSPSPSSSSTAALRIVPDPVGSWLFGASRAACSTAVPRGLPLTKIPSALVRRRSRREGGNTAGAGSA
ncbi:hypothetical protein VNO78_11429 [Psophocarpus tetragonolobus]|uniref:Uncharacterized protein n=1 Tax=Psophocarpus tetragonolobus TaxID=3891 RepID=A0AAN9STR8_PSOTE